MNIYDRFPSYEQAKAFAQITNGQCFHTQEDSDKVDPFPYELQPPIVLTPRQSPEAENLEQQLVKEYGGQYAGT